MLVPTAATVGLCPTTEADLADGIFDLPTFVGAGGTFGVGSDSNVAIDPFAELRLLEQGQRLTLRRRNMLGGHSGRMLWQSAAKGGAQALRQGVGRIAEGARADLVTIEPAFETEADSPDFWLDSAIFSALESTVRDVMVAGRWVVRDGRHVERDAIDGAYRRALAKLRIARGSSDG
jgi:formimidoylglutamate deiminase